MYQHIGIIGLGLIGGSLAQLIRSIYPDASIYGISRSETTISYALDHHMIDDGSTSLTDIPQTLDLVFVCTPISLLRQTIESVSNHIQSDIVITDVGSIKGNLDPKDLKLRPHHLFIPGHPMAGKETRGIEEADMSIYENAPYILIPQSHPSYSDFWSFLNRLGFRVLEMSSETHDRLVGLASHFPYLMSCLTMQATDSLSPTDQTLFKDIIAGGFKDTTRVSGSSPEWGADICEANQKNLVNQLKQVHQHIDSLIHLLDSNPSELFTYFSQIHQLNHQIKSS